MKFHQLAFIFFLARNVPNVVGAVHGSSNKMQYFITSPEDTTVTSGHHARLSCSVGNKAGDCEWTKDEFSLGSTVSMAGFSRHRISDDRQHVCDLVIEPVLPLDQGVYHCKVSGEGSNPAIVSQPALLTVNSEPGKPHIVQAREKEALLMEQGEEVKVQCMSQGGRPPAEISWWDGDGNRIVSDIDEQVKRMDQGNTFRTISTLTFIPKESTHVQCSVSNPIFPRNKRSSKLQVKLRGAPTINIKDIKEGETFEVFCENQLVSKKKRYKWTFNDNAIPKEKENKLIVENFDKEYDGSIIKCFEDHKTRGKETIKVVKLKLQPNLRPLTRQAAHKGNKKHLMSCSAKDNPEATGPSYVWIRGKLEKNVMAVDSDGAEYECKLMENGVDMIKQMGKKLKKITKSIKKISKHFEKLLILHE